MGLLSGGVNRAVQDQALNVHKPSSLQSVIHASDVQKEETDQVFSKQGPAAYCSMDILSIVPILWQVHTNITSTLTIGPTITAMESIECKVVSPVCSFHILCESRVKSYYLVLEQGDS